MSILASVSIPSYSRDEETNRGVAAIGEHRVIFGAWDDPASAVKYDRYIGAWLAAGRPMPDVAGCLDYDASFKLLTAGQTAAGELPAGLAVGPISFDAFTEELLELYHHTLRSKSTRRGMIFAIGELKKLGVVSTSDLTVGLIARLVSSRKPNLSPATVRGLLRYVQALCSYCQKSGYIRVSPFAIRPLRTWVRVSKPKGVRHLTRAQIRAMLDVMEGDVYTREGWAKWRARRLLAMFSVCVYAGLRRGELQWLQLDDLDLEQGIILVVSRQAHRLKTDGSEKPVICVDALRKILVDHWLPYRLQTPPGVTREPSIYLFPNATNPNPYTGGGPDVRAVDRFKAIARRAGVPPEIVNWQACRRSLATHLEGHGAGPALIQRVLRHTSQVTSEVHYRRADIENMKRAFEGFEY